jgi:cyclic nucleotide-binding protein
MRDVASINSKLPNNPSACDLKRLPDQMVRELLINAKPWHLKKRQELFCCGDRSDGCFWLNSGFVKTSVPTTQGEEGLIRILGPGSIIGDIDECTNRVLRDEIRGAPDKKPSKQSAIRPTSPFYGRPRADEVYSTFLDKDARSIVGKAIAGKGGADIYDMILESLDLEFLQPNRRSLGRPNLRMLFSLGSHTFSQRFDLTNNKQRATVRNEIFPAMIANREAILASPDSLEKILEEHKLRVAQKTRDASDEIKFAQARERMGPGEQEIIMYGQRFWPVIDNRMGVYDYATLCLAIWHFQDQLRWVSRSRAGESVASQVIMLRLGTKWLYQLANQGELAIRPGSG